MGRLRINKLVDQAQKELKAGERIIRKEVQRAAYKHLEEKLTKPEVVNDTPSVGPSNLKAVVSSPVAPSPTQTIIDEGDGSGTSAMEEDNAPLLAGCGLPDPIPQSPVENRTPHTLQAISITSDSSHIVTHTRERTDEQPSTTAVEISQADIASNPSIASGLRSRAIVAVPAAGRQELMRTLEVHASTLGSPMTPDPTDHNRRPPILVKVTGYRVLNTMVVITLGIWKGVESYRGNAIISNALDIVLGVVLAITLYWLGLYESVEPRRLEWFFHVDYALVLQNRWLKWRSGQLGHTFTTFNLRRYPSDDDDDGDVEFARDSLPVSPHDQC